MNCPGDKDLSLHYIDLSLLLISSSNFIAAAAVASAAAVQLRFQHLRQLLLLRPLRQPNDNVTPGV